MKSKSMKCSFLFCLAILACNVTAWADVNLRLHYSLENDTLGAPVVQDVSGNGYHGVLTGSATIGTYKKEKVLKLSVLNSTVDLGEDFGQEVAGLNDFTVVTTVYVSTSSTLDKPGNNLLCFAHSPNVSLSDKGFAAFRLSDCALHYSPSTLAEELTIASSEAVEKNTWKTLVWTQYGDVVRFYINGELVSGGRLEHTLSELGTTTFNHIGAPLDEGESYLKSTYVKDFRIYNGAMSSTEVATLCGLTPDTTEADLKAHFTFENVKSDVGDYEGELKNGALLATVAGLPVLSLGENNGYFDMGTSVGTMLASLSDYTVSTNLYIPASTSLNSNGNFVFTFANSTDMGRDANGCIFFGANQSRYAITKSHYSGEQAVTVGKAIHKGEWHAFTYRQRNQVGQLFVDGVLVATDEVTLTPADLGATEHNFLGRSCYQGDVYLKGAQYNDFRIYGGAMSDEDIILHASNLATLNSELFAQQIAAVMAQTELPATTLYGDIALPTVGDNGVSIVWQSSDEYFVSSTGKVTRPVVDADSAHVVLTAIFTKQQIALSREYHVIVVPRLDDYNSVQSDMRMLTLDANLENLKTDLYLPSLTSEGSIIHWRSSRPDYMNNAGRLLRLSPVGEPQHVELTAIFTKGQVTDSCTFDIRIAEEEPYVGYLFAYFNGNAQWQEQICFALSTDGYNYVPLNDGNPIISSDTISRKKAVRDPHILRGEDGYFYMVITDMRSSQGWSSNDGLVLMRSKDLINWTHSAIDFPTAWPHRFNRDDLTQVWAPQTIYDPEVGKYMVYYAIGEKGAHYITYCSYANEDFTELSEPEVLYDHGANTIDADIVYLNGLYHMFFKTEGQGNGIMKATAKTLRGKWTPEYRYLQQTNVAVEGSGVFKLINSDEWILMYDCYTSGHYQYCKSTDLSNFTYVCNSANTDIFTPRHGTTIPITQEEAERLVQRWPSRALSCGKITSLNANVRMDMYDVDDSSSTIYLPVYGGTDLASFDPRFQAFPGTGVIPTGPQDFTQGPIAYTFNLNGNSRTYQVSARVCVNPILPGYHADPEILYSKKTGRFYAYTTTDGLAGWAGTYFTAYSSENLIDWTYEANVVDLATAQVIWANGNAWAPAIEEREVDGDYKYYFYFSGNAGSSKQIGVAVANTPVGPFVDKGESIIKRSPTGSGQQIDVDVFVDPVCGTPYIYWGNGYMAGAQLEDDMVTVKENTIKVLTPWGGSLQDYAYREAPYVFYREGLYYFLWSVDDTGSNNYHVAYGTSTSPLGPVTVADNPVILIQSPRDEIYGTAHNSILQIPGRDEWYIVYHRINKDWQGKNGSGYHRETCIDRLYFNPDGTIRKVVPTHAGPAPVNTWDIVTNIQEPLVNSADIIASGYYSLQGICLGDLKPTATGVYVHRQIFSDGATRSHLIFVR